MAVEHFDVLIMGAGLSGIDAAHHLQKLCPNKAQREAQVPTYTDEDNWAFVMPPEERIGGPNGHRFTLPQSDSGFSQQNPHSQYFRVEAARHRLITSSLMRSS